jgi:hypothetical protein
MQNGEETNTNIIVFGLTRPELELTIYRTGGEHSNNYPTDAVVFSTKLVVKMENTVHNRK